MRTDFETAGDIRDVDLLAAFVGFWKSRASGAISFSRAATSAAFGLAEGEIVSISSTESRFESSAILVRAGKLDATALERLSIPEGTDGALAALQTGILTKREWRWGEKIRAIEVLADLLAWPDGKYYFDGDARPVAGDFTLTIPRLVLELFLRSRDRNLVEHQLGPSDAPLLRAADFDQEFTTFGLTADAESVVRLIDGRATADEIARVAPAEDFAVRKLLAALATLGLIRAARAGGAAAASGAESEHDEPVGAAEPAGALEGTLVLPPESAPRVDDLEAETGVPAADAWDRRDDIDAATRRIPGVDAENQENEEGTRDVAAPESREHDDVAPWDVPVRDAGRRRTSAFDFDPPGSTSSLEAFPFPLSGGGSETESASGRGAEEEPGLAPILPAETFGTDAAPRPGGAGPGTILGILVAGLVVAIAAVLFFRSRSVTSGPSPGVAVPTASVPAPSETRVPRTAAPAPSPAGSSSASIAAAVAVSPRPGAPAARPTLTARAPAIAPSTAASAAPRRTASVPMPARVAAVRATAVPPPARAVAPAEAVPSGNRPEWSSRASRDRRRLASDRATRYTIQLELACEVPSLTEAWKHDRPAGSMWLLETRHGSRDCFRVMWGRYPSLDAAKRAKTAIPSFFTTPSNHPAVVSAH